MDTSRSLPLRMAVICTLVFGVTFLFGADGHCVARVLETAFTVDDSNTYTSTTTNSYDTVTTDPRSHEIITSLTVEVTANNGGGNYDLTFSQSGGTRSIDGETPVSIATGSDVVKQNSGRGRYTHLLDFESLFPSEDTGETFGVTAEVTGLFSASAVDVNDTWTQTVEYTGYDESKETVTVLSKLLEWTTRGGYNVAKISQTYTVYLHEIMTDDTEMQGTISITNTLWYAYAENLLVEKQAESSGTLDTYPEGVQANAYDIIYEGSELIVLD